MVQRSIIRFPNPTPTHRPKATSPSIPPKPKGPGRGLQKERFAPTFNRLTEVLNKPDAEVELKSDPFGIAPERTLVFITAGSIQNFARAAQNVGLNVISELEFDTDVPEDFKPPNPKGFAPILYATMPTLTSIQQMLTLWNVYVNNQEFPTRTTPWRDLFELLVEIRVWGPEDRLPEGVRTTIKESLPFDDLEPVKLELEILPVANHFQRNKWTAEAKHHVARLGGKILNVSSISEDKFIYEALLIELSAESVRQMLEDPCDVNGLATVEGIQFILPQSIAQSPPANPDDSDNLPGVSEPFESDSPLRCALFDGTASALHPALDGGVEIEDINDLVRMSQVNNRFHATSMASLILRGDLNADGAPLTDSRLLNVPILIDTTENQSSSPPNRLFIDVVHYTLLKLFSNQESPEHQIFVINFSVGIASERFSGRISALARLLDWWSYTHGVLFIISAGNISDDLIIREMKNGEFEARSEKEQQNIIRQALRELAYNRTLLAPAESVNGLTVGALSEDLTDSSKTRNTFTLDGENSPAPALSSALGLGKSRTVKPDLLASGGRHEYSLWPAGDDSILRLRRNTQTNGLVVASPRSGIASPILRSRGTSCATALTTRAVLQSAAWLTSEDGPFQGEELPRQDLALLTRALAINSTTWPEDALLLYEEEKAIHGKNQWFRSKEEVAKHYGFGVLSRPLMQECTDHRATLVGLGTISKDQAQVFRFPLPPSLSGDKIGRTFRVTVAWFSPVDPYGSRYRMAALEACAGDNMDQDDKEWGLNMKTLHLDEKIIRRGSVWSRRLTNGKASTPNFGENAVLPIRVQCKDSANGNLNPDDEIRYALVVTLEVENTAEYDIHEEIQSQIRLRLQQNG